MTLRRRISNSRRFDGTCRMHLQRSSTKIRPTHFLYIYLWSTSSSHPHLDLQSDHSPSSFQPKLLMHVFLPCLLHNPPIIFFSLIIRIIFGEDYKQCCSSLSNFSCRFRAVRSEHSHQHPVLDTINHPHPLMQKTNCYTQYTHNNIRIIDFDTVHPANSTEKIRMKRKFGILTH